MCCLTEVTVKINIDSLCIHAMYTIKLKFYHYFVFYLSFLYIFNYAFWSWCCLPCYCSVGDATRFFLHSFTSLRNFLLNRLLYFINFHSLSSIKYWDCNSMSGSFFSFNTSYFFLWVSFTLVAFLLNFLTILSTWLCSAFVRVDGKYLFNPCISFPSFLSDLQALHAYFS